MSNYTKVTNFTAKDSLPTGNANKVVRGSEIDTEFNNVATAIATKTDNASANITGGTITGITDLAIADGGTGASTATAALNNLLPSQATASNKYLKSDGTNASWDALDISTADITGTLPIANGGTGASSASAARTALGLAIGTDVQGYDPQLADIAGLTPTNDGVVIGDGTNFVVESGATLKTSLGLTIGTDVQAYDAQLSDIAGLTPTDGNFIVGDGTNFVTESGSTVRTSLGLGSIATQDSSNVTITGGSVTGITDLAVADGGTGASTAANARVNLLPSYTSNATKVLAINSGGTDVEWVTPAVGTGDVVGPGSATDNAFARFDLTTGKLIQNSSATLNDSGAPTFVGSVAVSGTSATGADIKLYEDTDNGTNYVGLKAPASIASDLTWTLPSTDGTNGQALVTNGTGTLSFSSISASPGGSNTQLQYNSSGSFAGASGLVTDGTNLTINGQGDLRFADSDSSNWVAFQAPATVSSNVTWTLPSADGTNGQVLSTNGSGTLAFTTASGGGNTTTSGLYEHANTISANYTISSGNNALSAGPVTVNSGVTVTVPSGSVWTVV